MVNYVSKCIIESMHNTVCGTRRFISGIIDIERRMCDLNGEQQKAIHKRFSQIMLQTIECHGLKLTSKHTASQVESQYSILFHWMKLLLRKNVEMEMPSTHCYFFGGVIDCNEEWLQY